MSICYYVPDYLQDYEGRNDTFLTSMVVNMPFAKEDKILIKNSFELKGYNAKHLVLEFPSKSWNVSSVYNLLQKL